ncbi:biofilm development regulator YmgB/AriR family protein [Pantoea agglomerans]|uniref:biofilm development regulator YmgB/AriR family protein n=1 Tax=Enterobacter agglomerans TaxID=549 RepID=UPI0037C81E41
MAESEEASWQEIMFYLIAEMEISTDVLRLDILRGCLEILMGLKETPGSSCSGSRHAGVSAFFSSAVQ